MRNFIAGWLFLFILLADQSQSAERSATSPSSIRVPAGFRIELLRSAQPEEGSWISMTFDDQGRIIVGEDVAGLARITLGSSPEESTFEKLPGTETLKHCRGVLYAFDSIYAVATDGEGVYRLRDTNADGVYDEPELIVPLVYNSRYGHGANQLTLGPDGMIYAVIGNDVAFPAESDPKSPYRGLQNDWLLPSPKDQGQDDRVGYILRMDPDGGSRTILAGGLRNQVDVAFHPDGEMFTWDADMEWDVGLPWYRPTRINHVVSGGEYGWRWGTGKWPAWYPDSLPSNLDTGLGSPTGLTFGTTSNWPQQYREALYAADWQNGRILLIQLNPQGASYTGESTVFVEGSPLNVCDMAFGPDGALYFITGGRGSQSGLYRITCPEPDKVAPLNLGTTESNVTYEESAAARQTRRQLEALHVAEDFSQLEFIWSQLGSEDVWLRFAARVALENQPVDSWRKRVATAADSPERHTALMALARLGEAADQKIVLKGLKEWDWTKATPEELICGLRTVQLSLIRQGPVDDAVKPGLLRKLHQLPRQESFAVNWLLSEILVALKSPEAIERTLTLMEEAGTQEEQIQFVKTLTQIEQGWTPPQREQLLNWLVNHRQLPGGKLVKTALQAYREQIEANLSSSEREQFAPLLVKISEPVAEDQETHLPDRPLVRAWTMEDLEGDVAMLRPQDRSVEAGRAALGAAICLRCHKLGDRGGQVGPDLTSVGKRFDGRTLLESILDPSKEIDPKYHNSIYQLEDGRVISGRTTLVSKEMIGVEIDPLTGKSVNIPRDQIVDSKSSSISPMPQGLLNTLTRDEILDLIAYLRTGGKTLE
ncbi:heme-binding protein [Planctomicrobium sp. SH661]|uniref:heme-binding protein n=1 Tax=Planctomicrobium sp. SH661 TaxID=3448124 RepID=UPI003F5C6825